MKIDVLALYKQVAGQLAQKLPNSHQSRSRLPGNNTMLASSGYNKLRDYRMNELFPFYTIGHYKPTAKATDFEIMRFGEMDEPDVEDIHKHSFYEILWTEAGKSKQTIDYKEYEVLPNSLFLFHQTRYINLKNGSH